jgi:hypothetical protein
MLKAGTRARGISCRPCCWPALSRKASSEPRQTPLGAYRDFLQLGSRYPKSHGRLTGAGAASNDAQAAHAHFDATVLQDRPMRRPNSGNIVSRQPSTKI